MLRLLSAVLALALVSSTAQAEGWHGSAAGGGDFAFVPEATGFGFVLFDVTGEDKVGKGDVRLHYNTDTIHLAIERVPMGENFEFSVALRGEIFMAGLLHQYYQQGLRLSGLGFRASYVVLMPKIQWHFADRHTLEVLTDVRYWMFGDKDTLPAYLLPANAWVFEPRLGYIYWNIDSPGEEYRASKLFPRIEGIAVGASVGVDVRSDVRAWGFTNTGTSIDGRNDPTKAIWTLNQWLRGGWNTGDRFRLELQETFNWGWNQDDLTRMRVGGMNPYVLVIPGLPWSVIPGLPWSANISERLAIAQLSGHIKPKKNKPQELGLLVSGGTIIAGAAGRSTPDWGGRSPASGY